MQYIWGTVGFVIGYNCFSTCPSSKLPLGIRLSVNSPKSCDADVFRVLAYLTKYYHRRSSWRPWTSQLGALWKGKFASIDIIRALDHLHTGVA